MPRLATVVAGQSVHSAHTSMQDNTLLARSTPNAVRIILDFRFACEELYDLATSAICTVGP
ncbi:hypothetical protein FPJ27_14755 [Burkholderia sp. MS455]|nr:hypothetical protein FPJ27_14755 [Burkholderia sp. MS455]